MSPISSRRARLICVAAVVITMAGTVRFALTHYLNTHPSGFTLFPGERESELPPGTDLIQGTGYAGRHRETEDGRHLLWARGPMNLESGEWFDVTDSPLDPERYGNGIGKDTIRAIDHPEFYSIQDEESLRAEGFDDESMVIGYVHHGEAKAYPIDIMHIHELVNDAVGGHPVTVGW